MKISKTARAFAKTMGGNKFDEQTKEISQLIGQFCGTDHSYRPGDTFVYFYRFCECRGCTQVNLVDTALGHGISRWFTGGGFWVYKVVSATPCFVKVRRIKSYFAYGRWHTPAFNVENLHGLFEMDTASFATETYKVHATGQAQTLAQFTRMLECNQALPVQQGGEIMFDSVADKLVVLYGF